MDHINHEDLYETNADYRKAADNLFAIERRATELDAERSFRKVWGAIGVLLFLYGLFYGVYLSK
jgi:hypothetical protein